MTGNYSSAPSTAVIGNLARELMNEDKLASNPIEELDVWSEQTREEEGKPKPQCALRGSVQEIILRPFGFNVFTEGLLLIAKALLRSGSKQVV